MTGLWMFLGGRKRARESDQKCLRREIKEELPELKVGKIGLWKEVVGKNRRSGRKMSDAVFIAKKASGRLLLATSIRSTGQHGGNRAAFCSPLLLVTSETSCFRKARRFAPFTGEINHNGNPSRDHSIGPRGRPGPRIFPDRPA